MASLPLLVACLPEPQARSDRESTVIRDPGLSLTDFTAVLNIEASRAPPLNWEASHHRCYYGTEGMPEVYSLS